MKNLNRNKRALSPVIATVILIAVTIVVAVSVAYWMGAIAGSYTSFEQIEMPGMYAQWDSGNSEWTVTMQLKNTGSADASIDNIFINGIPMSTYGAAVVLNETNPVTLPTPVYKGATIILIITLTPDSGTTHNGFAAGSRVDIKIHTAAGRDYPGQVKLP